MKKVMTLIIAFITVVLDQVLKEFVVTWLKPIGRITVIDNLLNFVYVENRGMAFGLLEDHRWVFLVATSIIIAALIVTVLVLKDADIIFYISASLLIGGGIGNMIDRIFYGYVVDYIQLSFFPPVCNFADYCVTAGVVLLLVFLIFRTDFLKDKKAIHDGKL